MITLSAHAYKRCFERRIKREKVIALVEKQLGPKDQREKWPKVPMTMTGDWFIVIYDHATERVITVVLRSEYRHPGTARLRARLERRAKGKSNRQRRDKQARRG